MPEALKARIHLDPSRPAVRQSTMQMRRNELNAAQAQFAGFRFAIVNNCDVAQLWAAGSKDGSLDEADETRYSTLLSELFWSVSNAWARHQPRFGRRYTRGELQSRR